MQVKSIAECSKEFWNTFDLQLGPWVRAYNKLQLSSLFCLFLRGRFTQVFTVLTFWFAIPLNNKPLWKIKKIKKDKKVKEPRLLLFLNAPLI